MNDLVAATFDFGDRLVTLPRLSAIDILSSKAEGMGPSLDLATAPGLREASAAS
jgi:hypothetical protein